MALTRDREGRLELGGVSLERVAREHGTPCYVYDLDAIRESARTLRAAFEGAPHLVCYALKANSAGAVVRTVVDEGCGADVVSGGELRLALACGVAPDRVVYSGVAKRDDELDLAIGCGPAGIAAIQLESLEEIARVEARARQAGRVARVSLRLNPEVDLAAATHAHMATGHDEAKFGVPLGDAPAAAARVGASGALSMVGMTVHAGSQFRTLEPYVRAARALFETTRALREGGGLPALTFVDSGGGFGVDYGDGLEATPAEFVAAARREQRAHRLGDLSLHVEPGRALVAAHGLLLSRVVQSKVTSDARWLMIDAGMNDLVRPALYQARHRIVPLGAPGPAISFRVVGPVCESADDFGAHDLPLEPPEQVAVLDAGAYGYTMASSYNGRALPAEVFVRGGQVVGSTSRAADDAWSSERARAGRAGVG